MKANSNIALEFMQMLSQILEAGKVEPEPEATPSAVWVDGRRYPKDKTCQ